MNTTSIIATTFQFFTLSKMKIKTKAGIRLTKLPIKKKIDSMLDTKS